MDQIRETNTECERTDAVRQLWEVHAEIVKKRGYHIDQLLKAWTQRESAKLSSPGAQVDFDELSANGCAPQLLAALLALVKWSPATEGFWQQIHGNPEKRRRVVKSLEKAASTFELAVVRQMPRVSHGCVPAMYLTSASPVFSSFLPDLRRINGAQNSDSPRRHHFPTSSNKQKIDSPERLRQHSG